LKRHVRSLIPAALLAAAGALVPTAGTAQDYTWTLSLMGGVGGSLSEGGSSEAAYQMGFGLQFEPHANVWLKAGELDFETGSGVGQLQRGSITYVNLGGEYQFSESYYESGLYLGLGAYDLEARRVVAEGVLLPPESDTIIGLVIGATGEFKITPSFVVLAEISGHVLDSSDLRVLGTAHFGFAFHF
jgi:hypothetical protein